MAESVQLLSEEESARVAEVSLETIRQYMQCGLLDPVIKDHRTYFQETDIRTLFFTRAKPVESKAPDIKADNNNSVQPSVSQASASQATNNAAGSANLADPAPDVKHYTFTSNSSPKGPEAAISAEPAPAAGPLLSDTASVPNTGADFADSENTQDKIVEQSRVNNHTEQQHVSQLPALTNRDFVEITKTLKEQIQILRDERDWLRERVEKLESRSEREQMLLMSESENVRKLIQQGDAKPSFWQRALPWFAGQNTNRRDGR